MEKKKGISLITLVITIVVIIILVGAILLSIANNNPIKQAQKAAIREDIISMLEKYNLIYVTELGKNKGNASNIQKEAFDDVVDAKYKSDFYADAKGIVYNCKDETIKEIIKELQNNKLFLTCEMAVPNITNIVVDNVAETTARVKVEAQANEEGAVLTKYIWSIDNGKTYKESSSSQFNITGLKKGETNIVKIKVQDSNGNESAISDVPIATKVLIEGVAIPNGFYYVGGTKSAGLVISDNAADENKGTTHDIALTLIGNQYVWIPVESTSDFARKGWSNSGNPISICTEPYANGYVTEANEYDEMRLKVVEGKGFFVGRYEASKESKIGSKALKTPCSNMSWSNNKIMSTNPTSGTAVYECRHASEELGYTSVQSTLLYGVQWDSMLKFIESSNVNVTSTSDWGNYIDVAFQYKDIDGSMKNKTANDKVIIPTGSTDRNMKQNIYDVSGNLSEWTMESLSSYGRVLRGGTYFNKGGDFPASFRGWSYPNEVGSAPGFRLALYLK